MQLRDGTTLFSATDLVAYLECEHLTVLDFQSLDDADMRAGRSALDESAELIARKGDEHERAYLQRLRSQGRAVVDIAVNGGSIDDKVARTLHAMHQGVDVIYQATLRDGPLIGHADFLRRVDGEPSELGAWRYEVADTKLARSAKAKFLVQLAFYSALLAKAQGAEPRLMHVVLGDHTERAFRCADYMHYYRSLLVRFLARVQALADGVQTATYPLPVAHCDLCHWRERCEARRVADDHLCQVANISRIQWAKLQAVGVDTMARLAALPAGTPIPRLNAETLERLRSQAELQDRARRTGQREMMLLPPDPEARRGFHRLPEPNTGDMFFDMEGDPLEDGGLGAGTARGAGWPGHCAGQAELVIVSMTTSSEQDLPRHLEFLYSKNRLNVAVSRAKCLAIVIANPSLMAIKCHTPEQMALVNTLCWVAEAGRPS